MAPRVWNLCGDCWAITPDQEWPGLAYAEDGSLTEAFDDPPLLQCPACNYLHRDDDADPGVWAGSVFELAAIRRRERDDAR